eukprot:scaffold184348_cov22-Tisochrysis_lutea.AAC.2
MQGFVEQSVAVCTGEKQTVITWMVASEIQSCNSCCACHDHAAHQHDGAYTAASRWEELLSDYMNDVALGSCNSRCSYHTAG